jgi:hypothetical protein
MTIDIEAIEIARAIATARGPKEGGRSGLTVLLADHRDAKAVLDLIRAKEKEAAQKVVSSRITKEAINLLTPEHGRMSCTDEGQQNAGRDESGYPRCSRCYLLYRMGMGESLEAIRERVNIDISISPKYTTKTVEVREVIPD